MKTINYSNKIRSHMVTIVPMALFTPKSTSKLRSALHFIFDNHPTLHSPRKYCSILNNHYNHGFHNTFDYNQFIYSDYLPCTVSASAHIIR